MGIGTFITVTENTKLQREDILEIYSKEVDDNHKTLTRILICQLRDRNLEAVTFPINNSNVNSVLINIKTGNYRVLMGYYGHKFILELLNVCEEMELYEICSDIKKEIEFHNKTCNGNMPTK